MDDGDGEEGKSEPQNGHRHDLRKRKVKKVNAKASSHVRFFVELSNLIVFKLDIC